MAALDGYRLATMTNPFESGIDKNLSAIVPRNTLNHLNSLLSDEGDLYIAISPRDIVFKFDNANALIIMLVAYSVVFFTISYIVNARRDITID